MRRSKAVTLLGIGAFALLACNSSEEEPYTINDGAVVHPPGAGGGMGSDAGATTGAGSTPGMAGGPGSAGGAGAAGGPGAAGGAGAAGGPGGAAGGALDAGQDGGGQQPGADGSVEGGSAGDGGAPKACDKNLEPMPGQAMCDAPLKPGDDRLCEFMHNGTKRIYYVYAPKSFNPCEPAALVMDCHGATESAEVHVGKKGFQPTSPLGYGSSWRRAVQGDNAIVVTPEGLNYFWNEGSDPAYVNAVAERVKKIADINPERMYMTGISMGGMMTYANSCTANSMWRGMAPIAMLANDCPMLPRPTPLISFHAPTDSITSYPNDRTNTEKVAKLNNCKSGPKDWATYGGPNSDPRPHCFANPPMLGSPPAADPTAVPMARCPTTAPESKCIGWDQCDNGVEVVFCSVTAAKQSSGGHLLYNNDTGLNLPQVAWPFFKKFWK